MDNCARLEPIDPLLRDKTRQFQYYLESTEETVRTHLGTDKIQEVWFKWWGPAVEILKDWTVHAMFIFNMMDNALRSPANFESFIEQNSIAEVSRKVEEALMRLRLVFDCVGHFEGGNLRSFYADDVVRVAEFLVNVYDAWSDGESESSQEVISLLDSDD